MPHGGSNYKGAPATIRRVQSVALEAVLFNMTGDKLFEPLDFTLLLSF